MRKLLFTLLIVLTSHLALASTAELKMKFIFPDGNSPDLENFRSLNGLTCSKHAEYEYREIYLDTPELNLFEKKLSLSFRQNNFGNKVTYEFQLKSELANQDSIRLEIHKNDIIFFSVDTKYGRVPLTSVLDKLFELADQDTVEKEDLEDRAIALKALQSWFKYKISASTAPLKKLRRILGPNSTHKIQSLRPVLIGLSRRFRYHILGKEGHGFGKDMTNLNMRHKELPTYFVTHPTHIWVMEASRDHAIFHSVFSNVGNKHVIDEIEIVNKYKSDNTELVRQLMDGMAFTLQSKFKAKKESYSMYHQSMIDLK